MIPTCITQTIIHVLDRIAGRFLPPQKVSEHLKTGRCGEDVAYFYLRKQGYVMGARNFRSPRCNGEIDLIGWQNQTLCFIEVKTRSTRDVKPPEAAVDARKTTKSFLSLAIISVTSMNRASGDSML